MIPTILTFGSAGLLILAFVFVAAFMVRGIVKAIKGDAILPDALTDDEVKAMRSLEASARSYAEGHGDETLGLSVALHELDAARAKAELKEIEDGVDKDR